tara:strand:+ start:2090 stop:2449 length:360 start_codon:yes stop_codon:yes gene_type:complete
MKKIFRAIIKILFVVVIPVIVSALVIKFFLNYQGENWIGDPIVGLAVLGIVVVWANALFYSVFLAKTKVLPKITVNTVPMVGFAIGADSARDPWSWIILIPFVSIEFKTPYEKNEWNTL